jgi:hypothetical protein
MEAAALLILARRLLDARRSRLNRRRCGARRDRDRRGRGYESRQSNGRIDHRLFAANGGLAALRARLEPVSISVAIKARVLLASLLAGFAAPIRIAVVRATILTAVKAAILIAIRAAVASAELGTIRTIRALVALLAVRPLLERLGLRLWRREMRLSLGLRLLRLIGRLGLESRGGRRRQPLGQWREAIGDSREIIIVLAFILCLEGLAAKIICLLLRGRNQTKIVLRVLQQVFSHDDVAGGLGVSRELEIFLRDMLRRAANLDVGTVRLEGARQGIRPLAPIVAPAQPLVLSWSH